MKDHDVLPESEPLPNKTAKDPAEPDTSGEDLTGVAPPRGLDLLPPDPSSPPALNPEATGAILREFTSEQSEACGRIIAAHQQGLLARISRTVARHQDRDDVLSEVCVRWYRWLTANPANPEDSIGMLYAQVPHAVSDFLRSEQRRASKITSWPNDEIQAQSTNEPPQEVIEFEDLLDTVRDAPQISPIARKLIELFREWHGLPSQRDLAGQLGVPRHQIESGLADLRQWLARHFPKYREDLDVIEQGVFDCVLRDEGNLTQGVLEELAAKHDVPQAIIRQLWRKFVAILRIQGPGSAR